VQHEQDLLHYIGLIDEFDTTNIIPLISNARLHVGPRNLPLIESILELVDGTVEVCLLAASTSPRGLLLSLICEPSLARTKELSKELLLVV